MEEERSPAEQPAEHRSEEHHHSNTEAHHAHKKVEISEMKSVDKYLLGAAVVQILLLVFIAFQINGLSSLGANTQDGNAPTAAAGNDNQPTPTVDMKKLVDDDAVEGKANAPVTIVEFSDYECPFCARFYVDTWGQLEEKYVKTGKMKFIYRDFPLSFHPQAQKAAEAAECAGEQGKYFGMHDLLFSKGVSGGVAGFKQYAKELGLDTGKFDTCLDSGKMAGETRKDFNDGQNAGVQGTPAFFVNGIMVSGAQPLQAFEQIIDAELEKQ